ncbi:MAG: MurT ligase domain-containing protein, partial [Candidatus Enterenecus sp.]
MRLILAVLLCKILRFVGGLVGKGSSLPGQFALKVCPDVLGRVKLPERVIAVTGSNGKTSTVEMIAAVLAADGKTVVYNKEGSNQIEGVTTLILSNCDLRGRMKCDILLLESDERYAKFTFKWFHPTHFVITNLYRDQLTRNGHPEWVYDAIRPAVHPDTTLVLNADDPLVSCFAREHDPDKVRWFGLEECSVSTKEPRGVYDDGQRCPVCKGRLTYSCYHYHHIGHYSCPNCGHCRQTPDFAVTELDLEGGRLTIDGQYRVDLAFRSIYNVYNILAAWSACALCGVDGEKMAGILSSYILKNGRMVTFTLGAHKGTLLTSKHENSVAYDTNLDYVAAQKAPCQVMVIVDAISRKYFTGETSWLWDIDFGRLATDQVKKIWLCGRYVNDLALRFDYTDIPAERIELCGSISEAAERLESQGDEDL